MAETLQPAVRIDVGSPMRQFRCAPVGLGGGEQALLVVFSRCAEDDPYHRMFFLPTDTLKLALFSLRGERLWLRDVGPGMIPGIWFCPVFVFDLDGDGVDEVWLVANPDRDHPLNYDAFLLERLSGADGRTMDTRPWPPPEEAEPVTQLFRNFIVGGYSCGRPRLILAQGTYGTMQLQCLDATLKPIWTRRIPAWMERIKWGARGSHMSPVVDIDGDGRDELLWGERCIDLDTGRDLWVADRWRWRGHSDVIQPTLDPSGNRWSVYTCRETNSRGRGVVLFDDRGREVWGRRGMGHMDMGWTARLGPAGEHLAYALEVGAKSAGPDGAKRARYTEYLFDLRGNVIQPPMPLYTSIPVDFDGDGRHELMYSGGERKGLVVDRAGKALFQLDGEPAYGGKLLDRPGEQIVTWSEDGTVRLYACPGAEDSPDARRRYAHPYYAACMRLWAVGYNRCNLGGL